MTSSLQQECSDRARVVDIIRRELQLNVERQQRIIEARVVDMTTKIQIQGNVLKKELGQHFVESLKKLQDEELSALKLNRSLFELPPDEQKQKYHQQVSSWDLNLQDKIDCHFIPSDSLADLGYLHLGIITIDEEPKNIDAKEDKFENLCKTSEYVAEKTLSGKDLEIFRSISYDDCLDKTISEFLKNNSLEGSLERHEQYSSSGESTLEGERDEEYVANDKAELNIEVDEDNSEGIDNNLHNDLQILHESLESERCNNEELKPSESWYQEAAAEVTETAKEVYEFCLGDISNNSVDNPTPISEKDEECLCLTEPTSYPSFKTAFAIFNNLKWKKK